MDGSFVDFVTGVMLFPSEALSLFVLSRLLCAVSVNDRHARKNDHVNFSWPAGAPVMCGLAVVWLSPSGRGGAVAG